MDLGEGVKDELQSAKIYDLIHRSKRILREDGY